MKHFANGSLIAILGFSFAGLALASEAIALDAATVQAGLMAAAPAKLSVAEQFSKTGVWADSNATANIESDTSSSASVSVGARGVITVAYPTGAAIVLTPADGGNGRVTWTCSSHAIPDELVPQGCTPAAA